MTNTSDQNLLTFIAPHRGKLILSSLLSIVATAMGLVPFICVYLIAIALLDSPTESAYLWQLAIVSLVSIIGRWSLLAIAGMLAHTAAYNLLYDTRLKLAEKFGTLPLGYFSKNSTGTLKKVMNEDVEYLELAIAHGIPEIVGTVATLILTAAYLFTVDWRMTLAALSTIPLIVMSQLLLFKDIKSLLTGYYQALNRMNETIIEYVQGIAVIKAFTQTVESFARYQNSVINYRDYEEIWAQKSLLPMTLFSVSLNANILIILPTGVWLLNSDRLEMPTLILFLLLGPGICAPLNKFLQSAEIFSKTQEGMKRLNQIMNEPAILEPEQAQEPENLTLEFKDVRFSYHDREILKGISFVIPQNSITALVGLSGSGKTTIARLIPRFWDVDSGEIYLGKANIKQIKTDVLMSKIAFIFQDSILFNTTIYDNIGMGNVNATESEIMAAAKSAQCHEFIQALPSGYQTVIGEKGAKLSGGQKQRIAIARAILKDAPIIILDEATAFIDSENEAQIQQAISSLVADKTLLIIAHRLSTITEADRILVVDCGKIVERGKHHDLLINSNLYHQMWSAHTATQKWNFDTTGNRK